MNIPEFERTRGVAPGKIVQVIRDGGFRKYDKYLHSKVKKPDEYAVMLVPEAAKMLEQAFPADQPVKARRSENRRLTERVQCRLSSDAYAALQQALTRSEYETIQGLLAHIINLYIEREEQAHGTSHQQ